jgi:hypothetical protein
MPKIVVHGATLSCDKGTSTSSLSVSSGIKTDSNGSHMATIEDKNVGQNISDFGQCTTTSNPDVQRATSQAQGVLTPQPCSPIISSNWSSGSSFVKIRGKVALTEDSTCSCQWTGTISVDDPGSDAVKSS